MKSTKNVTTAAEETEKIEKVPAKKTTTRRTTKKAAVSAEKPEAEKTAEAPKEVKKTTRRTTTRKTAVKETVSLQYMGKDIHVEEITAKVKELWKTELGREEKEMKSISIYLKPEENKAYYVINEDVTGSIDL